MTTALLISLATLLLVAHLSFKLHLDHRDYLETARNKSGNGFIKWWIGEKTTLLVGMVATYLLMILLIVLADRYELPYPITLMLIFGLLLISLGIQGWLAEQKFRVPAATPQRSRKLKRLWNNLVPGRAGRGPSLRRQLKQFWHTLAPHSAGRSPSLRRQLKHFWYTLVPPKSNRPTLRRQVKQFWNDIRPRKHRHRR